MSVRAEFRIGVSSGELLLLLMLLLLLLLIPVECWFSTKLFLESYNHISIKTNTLPTTSWHISWLFWHVSNGVWRNCGLEVADITRLRRVAASYLIRDIIERAKKSGLERLKISILKSCWCVTERDFRMNSWNITFFLYGRWHWCNDTQVQRKQNHAVLSCCVMTEPFVEQSLLKPNTVKRQTEGLNINCYQTCY